MYESAIKVLKQLTKHKYVAYIVGGYPRDTYLGYESLDIDICTNARPDEVESLFDTVDTYNRKYGCIHVIMDGFSFAVTTFRREISYLDGRHVGKFVYVDSLSEDLQRRDFIINTLCIDCDGKYVDLYGALDNLNHKIIRSMGNSVTKFTEDSLRMLRAIRFSTLLDFSLHEEVCYAILCCKENIRLLSRFRCKQELDKIFKSINCMKGIFLLQRFGLGEVLGCDFSNISYCSNYMGIWAQCIRDMDYPFTKKERKTLKTIQYLLVQIPKREHLQVYGKDVCFLIDEIRLCTMYHDFD